MTKFTFIKSSCVALGSFNIYVIQPQVLTSMGVLEVDAPLAVAGDLTAPGIRFQTSEATWTVRPDRLAVETTSPTIDCGHLVRLVLENLLWTPVMAVGLNYTYSSARGTGPCGILLPPDVQGASQCTAHVSIERGEATVNVQLSRQEEVDGEVVVRRLDRHDPGDDEDDPPDADGDAVVEDQLGEPAHGEHPSQDT